MEPLHLMAGCVLVALVAGVVRRVVRRPIGAVAVDFIGVTALAGAIFCLVSMLFHVEPQRANGPGHLVMDSKGIWEVTQIKEKTVVLRSWNDGKELEVPIQKVRGRARRWV